MMTVREVLPVRLRELREQAGLTQAQVAEAVGTATVQISRYETGTILPSIDTLVKIADVLDASMDYLVGLSLTPRVSPLASDDLTLDEQRLIQAIRDHDMRTTLVMLSLLVDRPTDANPDRDAEALRMRREKRQLQNRKHYASDVERNRVVIPITVDYKDSRAPGPDVGGVPSLRFNADAKPGQH